jgi:hypothetical protein
MILIVFAGSAIADDKVYVPKNNEELYRTWIKKDCKGPQPLPKRIYYFVEISYSFPYPKSTKPDWEGT